MGASGWIRFVPHDPDPTVALRAAQHATFEEGAYYAPPELASLEPGTTEPIDARIRALLMRCAEEGTHSVLDFHRIGDTPGYGVAASLTDDDLTHLFGTTQPTRARVTEKQDALIQHRRRGMASYVVVYDGDQPSEIAFAGISGD